MILIGLRQRGGNAKDREVIAGDLCPAVVADCIDKKT